MIENVGNLNQEKMMEKRSETQQDLEYEATVVPRFGCGSLIEDLSNHTFSKFRNPIHIQPGILKDARYKIGGANLEMPIELNCLVR